MPLVSRPFVFQVQFQNAKQFADRLGVTLYVSMSCLHEQFAIDIRVTRAVDGDNTIRIASNDHSMSRADDRMEPNVLRDTKLSHGLQARILRLQQVNARRQMFREERFDGSAVLSEKRLVSV